MFVQHSALGNKRVYEFGHPSIVFRDARLEMPHLLSQVTHISGDVDEHLTWLFDIFDVFNDIRMLTLSPIEPLEPLPVNTMEGLVIFQLVPTPKRSSELIIGVPDHYLVSRLRLLCCYAKRCGSVTVRRARLAAQHSFVT